MSDEYLWDRSGEPDAEIVELERLLGTLRHRPLPERRVPHAQSKWKKTAMRLLPIAAAVILATLWNVYHIPTQPAWRVTSATGTSNLYAGQWLKTDSHSTAKLTSDSVGEVDVDPGSELRVLKATPDRQQLALRRGVIHALIWAPPANFAVETPAARAVDLGCAYTLQVDERGDGLLTVDMGWVAFDFDRRESFIPAEAACRTYRGRGPGTPWFLDSDPALQAALKRFDETAQADALDTILSHARARDGLTLWHLLARGSKGDRRRVFARFAELIPLPGDVSMGGAIDGNHEALDRCWNALDLGNTDWWRTWKRRW